MTKTLGPILLGILLTAGPAFSQDVASVEQSVAADFTTAVVPSAQQGAQSAVTTPQPAVTAQQPVQPAPIYYSHAYDVRAKIHKVASFTTLPLVVGEFAVGNRSSTRQATRRNRRMSRSARRSADCSR